jgi:CBS domain-containing protein
MFVEEIMTRDVITVSPNTPLKTVGEIFKEKRISGMPVVDEAGNIVGIITLTDLMKILSNIYRWRQLEKSSPDLKLSEMFEIEKSNAKVKDFMSKNVVTLNETDSMDVAARKMFVSGVHTLPVVRDGKIVGIIGKRDLVYVCF